MADREAKTALYDALATAAKALASGRRAEIIDVLAQGERSVEDTAAEIGHSVANTSQHLRVLAGAGLVTSRRQGNRVLYRLSSDRVEALWEALRAVAAEHVAGLDRLAADYLGDRGDLEEVGRSELARRLDDEDLVVWDVRPPAEFVAGHVTGAVSVPPDEVRRRLHDLPSRERGGRLLPGAVLRVRRRRRAGAAAGGPSRTAVGGRIPGVATGRAPGGSGAMSRDVPVPLPDGHPFAATLLGADAGEAGGPDLRVVAVTDEGLGNTSWVLDLGTGEALVVDPERDPVPYLHVAERLGAEVTFAAETHLHADFVTGSRELAASGSRVVASAAGDLAWPHVGFRAGDELDLGRWQLRALATPGHTPEHLAYLLSADGRPRAVFTGGSLLVGSVARTDLIDPADTEALTRALWRSIHHELLTLPDDVAVLPTHGAGSFCSAAGGAPRWTTIGAERRANPLLAAPDEDAFVRRLLDSLGTYPPYFLRLRDVNRRGPAVLGAPGGLPLLGAEEVVALRGQGAVVVDVRSVAEFAAGHVPGRWRSRCVRSSGHGWGGPCPTPRHRWCSWPATTRIAGRSSANA